jgi:hypothetical protein
VENSLGGFNGRFEPAEERMNEFDQEQKLLSLRRKIKGRVPKVPVSHHQADHIHIIGGPRRRIEKNNSENLSNFNKRQDIKTQDI